jgi:hypothetical protein
MGAGNHKPIMNKSAPVSVVCLNASYRFDEKQTG